MGTFESTLREILAPYTVALVAKDVTERERLMYDAFQTTSAKHTEYGSVYHFAGPGLCSLRGTPSVWRPEATQYEDRQGRETLPAVDNGIVELGLAYGQQGMRIAGEIHVRKIFLTFSPGLELPQRGTKTSETYTLLTEGRSLVVQFELGDGSYHLDREIGQTQRRSPQADWIGVQMTVSTLTRIRRIIFEPVVLEDNVLSSFLGDVGYDGLDRLVK